MENTDALSTSGSDTQAGVENVVGKVTVREKTEAEQVESEQVESEQVEAEQVEAEQVEAEEKFEPEPEKPVGVVALKQELLATVERGSADSQWIRGGLERMYFDHPQDPEISGMVEIDTTTNDGSVSIELLVPGDAALQVVRFVQSLKREAAEKPVEVLQPAIQPATRCPCRETICGPDTLPLPEPKIVPASKPVISSLGRLPPVDEDEDDGLPPEVDLDDPVADPESRAVRGAL
jgi:hypothetical protein